MYTLPFAIVGGVNLAKLPKSSRVLLSTELHSFVARLDAS